MTISVLTASYCSYRLAMDGHDIDPEQTLKLRDSGVDCPHDSCDRSQAPIATVIVDDKGHYYVKRPAF